MEKLARQIVKVFMDRRVNDASARMLAFWVVHEAGPSLDQIQLFCHNVQQEVELYWERHRADKVE